MKKYLWLLFVIFLPIQSDAQSLNARFSTSFYSWERQLSDSLSENHLRVYQTMQLTVGQLASSKLSAHFYGQASQDLAESADEDPIPRLYNAYLQWKERKGVLQRVRLGRQRIYSGVAYGTIDGVDLSLRAGKSFKVGGFFGFLVPSSNKIEIDSWDDSHLFGLRASANNLFGAKVLVSFSQRNRRPVSYSSPGRFTQRRLTFESIEQRLVGVDAYRRFSSRLGGYGRFDYDLEQKRVRRGQIELKFSATDKLEISGEFFHRAPLIAANSVLSVFSQSGTQDIVLRGNYRLKQSWSVNGNVGVALYDGDETVRLGLGVRCKYGYLGYNFRRGYGGQNNGFYTALNYPVTQKLGLIASSGFSRYRLFDENSGENTSLTGSLGANYRASKNFSLDFVGQGLRNRFYGNDLRLFLKANYGIFGKL